MESDDSPILNVGPPWLNRGKIRKRVKSDSEASTVRQEAVRGDESEASTVLQEAVRGDDSEASTVEQPFRRDSEASTLSDSSTGLDDAFQPVSRGTRRRLNRAFRRTYRYASRHKKEAMRRFLELHAETFRERPLVAKLQEKIHEKGMGVLPKEMVLVVTYHGNTLKVPFPTPMKVIRRMDSDFGCLAIQQVDRLKQIFSDTRKEVDTRRLLEIFDENIDRNPCRGYERCEGATDEDFEAFKRGKHHKKTKEFEADLPMFNKTLTLPRDDPHYDSRTILARGVHSPIVVDFKEMLEELNVDADIFLSDLLFALSEVGVKTVRLFDYSCSQEEWGVLRRERDYRLFGGRLTPLRRPTSTRRRRRSRLRS